MRVIWLALLVVGTCGRLPVRPLRRRTALRVLSRLVCEDAGGIAVSIDIGGTLAKVMLFQPLAAPPPEGEKPRIDVGDNWLNMQLAQSGEQSLSMYVPELGGSLHFLVFESRHLAAAMALVNCRPRWRRQFVLRATGGGSYKHQALLQRVDGLVLDDDASMVTGLNFLLRRPLQEGEVPSGIEPEIYPVKCALSRIVALRPGRLSRIGALSRIVSLNSKHGLPVHTVPRPHGPACG